MKFRETINTVDQSIRKVDHFSNGKRLGVVVSGDRLWPKYEADKAADRLLPPKYYTPPVPKPITLEQAQQNKIAEIDGRSQALLDQGFVHNTKVFGMSDTDQKRWNDMLTAANAELLQYPQKVADMGKKQIVLSDLGAVKSFITDYMTERESVILGPGRDLKEQVMDCTTVEEVDAIVDPRPEPEVL